MLCLGRQSNVLSLPIVQQLGLAVEVFRPLNDSMKMFHAEDASYAIICLIFRYYQFTSHESGQSEPTYITLVGIARIISETRDHILCQTFRGRPTLTKS